MRMQRLESASLVVLGFSLLEFLLITFAFIGMRARVSPLTVNDTRYFCAAVARIEGLSRRPATDNQAIVRL